MSGKRAACPVRLDQVVLDHPVDFGRELERVLLEVGHHVLPHLERLLLERRQAVALGEAQRPVEVLGLDVDRRELAAVGEANAPAAGDVVADLADRADRVLEREVAPGRAVVFEHAQDDRRRADLQERRVLAHVRVADDHVQAAEPLGVGVRLVARVDDRPRSCGGARHAFPDVLGALRDAVHRAACGLQHLARARVDLAGHEERDQHVGELGEVAFALDEVVLVAAVRVAGAVGVVLEQEHLAADAFFAEALLGALHEAFEDPLPRLVVHDDVVDRVALRRGVLGVAADVEVEAGAVLEEDVARPAPRHDPAEEVAGDLVGAEPALAAERARDAVLVLEAEDAPLHRASVRAGLGPAVPTRSGRTVRRRGVARTLVAVVPMSRLTSLQGTFRAHVLAARLVDEGFDVELRGALDGPYGLTVGDLARVDVYVPGDQIEEASIVLLVTEVDEVDDRFDDDRPPRAARPARERTRRSPR